MGWRALPTASQNRMGLTRAGMEGGREGAAWMLWASGYVLQGGPKGADDSSGGF